MTYRNRVLWAAYQSLIRMGDLDGLATLVAFKVALAKTQLENAGCGVMNDRRLALVNRLQVLGLKRSDRLTPEQQAALIEFEKEWAKIMDEETEFESHVHIDAKLFNACEQTPKPNDLAACMAVGVVNPPEDEPKVKKKAAPDPAAPRRARMVREPHAGDV